MIGPIPGFGTAPPNACQCAVFITRAALGPQRGRAPGPRGVGLGTGLQARPPQRAPPARAPPEPAYVSEEDEDDGWEVAPVEAYRYEVLSEDAPFFASGSRSSGLKLSALAALELPFPYSFSGDTRLGEEVLDGRRRAIPLPDIQPNDHSVVARRMRMVTARTSDNRERGTFVAVAFLDAVVSATTRTQLVALQSLGAVDENGMLLAFPPEAPAERLRHGPLAYHVLYGALRDMAPAVVSLDAVVGSGLELLHDQCLTAATSRTIPESTVLVQAVATQRHEAEWRAANVGLARRETRQEMELALAVSDAERKVVTREMDFLAKQQAAQNFSRHAAALAQTGGRGDSHTLQMQQREEGGG